jgi:predicted permease
MELSIIILTTTCMMGIMISIGALISKKVKITHEVKQLLMMIIINVALPAIILNGIFNTEINDALLSDMLTIFIISIVLNMLGLGLGWTAARIFGFHSIEAKKLAILAGIGNTGFIGIPLCAEIFGPVGGLLAAVFDSGVDFVTFSLVIMLIQQGNGFSLRQFKSLINIPFIAITLGILIAITGFEPPLVIKKLASYLSSLATPLAMIYIGLLISEFVRRKRKVPKRFVSVSLVMKLLLFPLIAIAILQFLPLSSFLKQLSYIQIAMPTFTLSTVLIARYTNDEESAVIAVIYSTICSLFTIPFVVYIANLL